MSNTYPVKKSQTDGYSENDDIIDSRKRMVRSNSREHVNFLPAPSPYLNGQNEQHRQHHRNFDINLYATKKSAAQGLLDLALLMANASQLKHIILTDGDHRFYSAMIALLAASITLQIMVGIALLFLARIRIYDYINARRAVDKEIEETDDTTQREQLRMEEQRGERRLRQADLLNNIIVAGIFVLTVINVFISAFGLNESPRKEHATVSG